MALAIMLKHAFKSIRLNIKSSHQAKQDQQRFAFKTLILE